MFADTLGALSLTGLLVPEAIAYSAIAGVPATFGIVGAIVGPLAYAVIGRSRLAVVSATSGAAALLAAGIASAAIPDGSRTDCAVALTLLVGVFFVIGAALRIASLTSFISRAVLHGFGLGLAITITVRQLPALLGLASPGGSLLQILSGIAVRRASVHLPSLGIGIAALVFLAASRRLRFAASGLVLIIGATLAMRFGPLAHLGIATAGQLVLQRPDLHLPGLATKDWLRLAQFAFPIAIVLLAESWATIRTLASSDGDSVAPEREIAALGLANLASGLLRGLPVGAGFSIGNASAQAGTKSRMGAIIAAVAVGVLVVTLPEWIALIPQPVLAAIVISALAHALSPSPIIALFHLKRDQWVALAAAVGVLVLGITNGLLVAVALSIMSLLRRLADAPLSQLGRIGSHDFVDCLTHPEAQPVPGILIIRPNAPLFFGNADSMLVEVGRRAEASDSRMIILSLEETNDIDSSTLDALRDFRDTMVAQGRALRLARVHDLVRSVLDRGGLADLSASSTFSVDDAVHQALAKSSIEREPKPSDPGQFPPHGEPKQ